MKTSQFHLLISALRYGLCFGIANLVHILIGFPNIS